MVDHFCRCQTLFSISRIILCFKARSLRWMKWHQTASFCRIQCHVALQAVLFAQFCTCMLYISFPKNPGPRVAMIYFKIMFLASELLKIKKQKTYRWCLGISRGPEASAGVPIPSMIWVTRACNDLGLVPTLNSTPQPANKSQKSTWSREQMVSLIIYAPKDKTAPNAHIPSFPSDSSQHFPPVLKQVFR